MSTDTSNNNLNFTPGLYFPVKKPKGNYREADFSISRPLSKKLPARRWVIILLGQLIRQAGILDQPYFPLVGQIVVTPGPDTQTSLRISRASLLILQLVLLVMTFVVPQFIIPPKCRVLVLIDAHTKISTHHQDQNSYQKGLYFRTSPVAYKKRTKCREEFPTSF